jgi:uncharacterized protein (DUF1499 family)
VAIGATVVVAGILAMVASGFGYRGGFWTLAVAFPMLKYGVFVTIAGTAIALIGALITRPGSGRPGFVAAGLATVLGAIAAGSVIAQYRVAMHAPPIHDITTDLTNPPVFVALRATRADAPNGVDYGGADVAAQQQSAFADIVPAVLPVPPGTTFDRALAAARDMGWQIASADSAAGRIEATATTTWFGFKDDIVIRVTAAPEGSRVDVRSASRLGQGDAGTNARRVRQYLRRLSRTP